MSEKLSLNRIVSRLDRLIAVSPDDVATFLQNAKASILFRCRPLCSRCARELPNTPNGKLSRAELCKSCKFQKWAKKQDPEVIRAAWRKATNKRRGKEPVIV